ncbi:ATP-dependent helicase HrpB [Streptomyces polyrhachis]|uniref:ATP-dependent helicase HrpB n=1 Tax=Streptomyces polyrhachis TaxID=1282885 RepID=A0ABW2G7B8_9ACTN
MTLRREALESLPVRTALPELRAALESGGAAVLCAPPGTGKTTLVPLELAGLTGEGPARRVLVAEPRRIAVRAAARRMAWLLGEPVGQRVGFTVRGERQVGAGTRVEVVTTGVLLRRLQRDPELAGVDAVVLDECHERHLDADTAVAFLLDVRAALRPELQLVAASATTDAQGWARLLEAPVVAAAGVSYPVEVVHAPPLRPVRPPHGMSVDPALLEHVAGVVRRALSERAGDVLCFLPGAGEIARVARLLAGAPAEVLQVHGRASAQVQDAVLAGDGAGRRVVLATSVAESSLTVPGVRVVVDAGLAREPRVDHARGLSALTTVRASRAAARQRAGRAGREAPGWAYRCWTEAEDGRLARFPSPEIAVADLTAFALQAACWGDPQAAGLALLDAPPAGAMAAAGAALRAIGAVDGEGRVTQRGRRMAGLGVHPRLARALLDGAAEVGARTAAEVVALLSEEPPRSYGDDLAAAWRRARTDSDAYAARWRTEARRLEGALGAGGAGDARGASPSGPHTRPRVGGTTDNSPAPPARSLPRDAAAGLIAALAFPERIARSRGGHGYLMVSGTGAEKAAGSGAGRSAAGSADRSTPAAPEWLAVAVADRPVGKAAARIHLAAPIDEGTARAAAAALLRTDDDIRWDSARAAVTARRVTRLGAVELAERPLPAPDPAAVREVELAALRREGLGLLRWSPEALALRRRLDFLHRTLGAPWPDVSDAALLAGAGEWLGRGVARTDVRQVLTALLPWAGGEAARLEELAPERLEVPSGSRVRIDYGPEQPVLAVKLQELFGLARTPTVAGVPLLIHLLSPAGRPAAVTSDLASFWARGYPAVRAELRGRYPRHPWPEDPRAAPATRRVNARRESGR